MKCVTICSAWCNDSLYRHVARTLNSYVLRLTTYINLVYGFTAHKNGTHFNSACLVTMVLNIST